MASYFFLFLPTARAKRVLTLPSVRMSRYVTATNDQAEDGSDYSEAVGTRTGGIIPVLRLGSQYDATYAEEVRSCAC